MAGATRREECDDGIDLDRRSRRTIEEILGGRLSLREYLRSIRGPLESAIFSWDDPLPGLLDLPLFAYTAGKRLFRPKEALQG